ncbi:MAG: hypothetical protein E7618_01510 [Ruminococcaceae bacterium]|nr:hypothetical protein [Oscillospiraceae bacterium]
MRSIVIYGPGDIRLSDIPEPPMEPRDVHIRVRYCGICGTDLGILSGDMGFIRSGLIKYPARIGHEWSGVVEKVGPAVTMVKPGDRVIGDNSISCGECEHCQNGEYLKCVHRRGSVGTVRCWPGAFADTMRLPEWHLHVLPDNVSFEEAAVVEPCTIAYNAVLMCRLKGGETVLVLGTGAIGLAAITIAKVFGAKKVIAVGRQDAKLEIAKQMGADVVVNAKKENVLEAVLRETDGRGADCALECSGAIEYVNGASDLIVGKGIFTLAGFYETTLDGFPLDDFVLKAQTLCGTIGHPGVLDAVVKLISEGKLNVKPLITEIVPAENGVEAFYASAKSSVGRIKTLVEFHKE